MSAPLHLPPHGQSRVEVLEALQALRQRDAQWRQGRVFSLVYHVDDELTALLKDAYALFFSENALNPTVFPSLRKMETEVVAMTATLLGGDGDVVGSMTSGGTESILMAVLTAREWARAHKPGIQIPEMILPVTAHPAFEKAAHYLGVKPVHIPVGSDFRADSEAMRAAITPSTVLLVGSAPAYPHGVVDPISEIARTAQEHGILCHVDACVGGFELPFLRRLGYPVPAFDFQTPGVTSMSADLHKYGYAAKGASVVLYRDSALRRHQFFAYTDWPGGIYASATMAGTRPAGPIAAAWAVLHYLGEEGYLALTERVMRTAVRLREGVAAIPGLKVLGEPAMSVFAIGSERLNVYEIGDEMASRGWHLDRQQFPPSLHVTVTPLHVEVAEFFLQDLAQATAAAGKLNLHKLANTALLTLANAAVHVLPKHVVSRLTALASRFLGGKGTGLPQRAAAMYGMMGTLPNRGDLEELVLDLLDRLTRLES